MRFMNNIKIKDIIIVILAIALAFSVYCIIKENEAIADGIKSSRQGLRNEINGFADKYEKSWNKMNNGEKKEALENFQSEALPHIATSRWLGRKSVFYKKYEEDVLYMFIEDIGATANKKLDTAFLKVKEIHKIIKDNDDWDGLEDISKSQKSIKKVLEE